MLLRPVGLKEASQSNSHSGEWTQTREKFRIFAQATIISVYYLIRVFLDTLGGLDFGYKGATKTRTSTRTRAAQVQFSSWFILLAGCISLLSCLFLLSPYLCLRVPSTAIGQYLSPPSLLVPHNLSHLEDVDNMGKSSHDIFHVFSAWTGRPYCFGVSGHPVSSQQILHVSRYWEKGIWPSSNRPSCSAFQKLCQHLISLLQVAKQCQTCASSLSRNRF